MRLPHLVNVGKLHSPHNPTNEKRFVVTMALNNLDGRRILWDEAVEKLSNNIVLLQLKTSKKFTSGLR